MIKTLNAFIEQMLLLTITREHQMFAAVFLNGDNINARREMFSTEANSSVMAHYGYAERVLFLHGSRHDIDERGASKVEIVSYILFTEEISPTTWRKIYDDLADEGFRKFTQFDDVTIVGSQGYRESVEDAAVFEGNAIHLYDRNQPLGDVRGKTIYNVYASPRSFCDALATFAFTRR